MQLTKFKHACFTLTKDMQTIVVDPGTFSSDFIAPDGVVATIITHQHADHCDLTKIKAISDRNPDMVIYADESITRQLGDYKTRSVHAGDAVTIAGFTLKFYGGQHATIHPGLMPIANLGVLVNDTLYYPGDSFALPDVPVYALALPAAAPWMKVSEAIEFLTQVKPTMAFPVHDAILSEEGREIYDRLYRAEAQKQNIAYERLTTPIQLP